MTSKEIESRCETIVKFFKDEAKTNNDALIFLDAKNMRICQGLIAWKSIGAKLNFNKEHGDFSDDWEWVWQFCDFQTDKLASVIGCNYSDATALFKQLKMLKLVYPDGTVNDMANALVRGIIKQNISKMTGRKMDAPAQPKDK